ncbi:MAG: DUF92 domain-containing protein [Terriglobales bacterium]
MLQLFLAYGWASSPGRLVIAVAVTVGFALLARALRGVSRSGMLAGGVSCFLLFAGAGPSAFAALAALFLLTWAATRLGYRRKQELGIAEHGEGRNAWQVFANLAVAAICSLAFGITGNRLWLVATAAALAEAATDTVASEVGQSGSRTALLITTWKPVTAGTDGGITIVGTIAGAIAGLLIAAVVALGGMIPHAQLWIPAVAGFAGMLLDSVLGATLQRRAWMNNEAVNLFGTLAAAAFGYAISVAVGT